MTMHAVLAAEIDYRTMDTPAGAGHYIVIEGEIAPGSWSQFFRLVRQVERPAGVYLDSEGGSVDDGLAIAKYIYEHELDTLVLRRCHSICAVMFLAGRKRAMHRDAALTVHNAYKQIGDWVVVDHLVNGTVAWFIGHMGYPLQLAKLWVSTPTESAAPITPDMNDTLELGFIVLD
jgi:hypothetical protein